MLFLCWGFGERIPRRTTLAGAAARTGSTARVPIGKGTNSFAQPAGKLSLPAQLAPTLDDDRSSGHESMYLLIGPGPSWCRGAGSGPDRVDGRAAASGPGYLCRLSRLSFGRRLRHGSSRGSMGEVPRRPSPNKRAAWERRERALVLPATLV